MTRNRTPPPAVEPGMVISCLLGGAHGAASTGSVKITVGPANNPPPANKSALNKKYWDKTISMGMLSNNWKTRKQEEEREEEGHENKHASDVSHLTSIRRTHPTSSGPGVNDSSMHTSAHSDWFESSTIAPTVTNSAGVSIVSSSLSISSLCESFCPFRIIDNVCLHCVCSFQDAWKQLYQQNST